MGQRLDEEDKMRRYRNTTNSRRRRPKANTAMPPNPYMTAVQRLEPEEDTFISCFRGYQEEMRLVFRRIDMKTRGAVMRMYIDPERLQDVSDYKVFGTTQYVEEEMALKLTEIIWEIIATQMTRSRENETTTKKRITTENSLQWVRNGMPQDIENTDESNPPIGLKQDQIIKDWELVGDGEYDPELFQQM